MKVSRLVLPVVLATVASLTAACGGGDESGKDAATINLAADWISPDITWLPYVVAMDHGEFEDAGLKVKLIQPPDNSSSVKLLASGQADIAEATITDMVFAQQEELPVISVANESQTNNWGLFGKPGEKFDVASLKGKRIGVYDDSFTKALLPLMLASGGLTMDDVKPVTASADTLALLLAGKIDVTTETTNFLGADVQTETGKPAEQLLSKDYGAPDMPIWVYAANTRWLKGHGDQARTFLAALEKATTWAMANPEDAVKIYMDHFKMPASEQAKNLAQWKATIPVLDAGSGLFQATDAQWADFAKALVEAGQLKKAADPSAYYTNEYLD
jgi:ABC-type nitrate/sulfonate/bicarbonate transport system substrate-binding protein